MSLLNKKITISCKKMNKNLKNQPIFKKNNGKKSIDLNQ